MFLQVLSKQDNSKFDPMFKFGCMKLVVPIVVSKTTFYLTYQSYVLVLLIFYPSLGTN